MTRLTSKPLFLGISYQGKKWVTFSKILLKNVLCEKGDEITRFDGSFLRERVFGSEDEVTHGGNVGGVYYEDFVVP
jgi:hypothetical protein